MSCPLGSQQGHCFSGTKLIQKLDIDPILPRPPTHPAATPLTLSQRPPRLLDLAHDHCDVPRDLLHVPLQDLHLPGLIGDGALQALRLCGVLVHALGESNKSESGRKIRQTSKRGGGGHLLDHHVTLPQRNCLTVEHTNENKVLSKYIIYLPTEPWLTNILATKVFCPNISMNLQGIGRNPNKISRPPSQL